MTNIIDDALNELEKFGSTRGYKICPSCNLKLGVRSSKCQCGHTFYVREQSESKIYDSPGKGRKKCHNCPNYVGVRTDKCTCGFDFSTLPKGSKSERERQSPDRITPELRIFINVLRAGECTIIHTASGKCPVDLDYANLDGKIVFDFCDDLIDYGIARNILYTPSAIASFVGHIVGHNSDEFRKFFGLMNEWYSSVIGHLD
jgi:hypothetical protein